MPALSSGSWSSSGYYPIVTSSAGTFPFDTVYSTTTLVDRNGYSFQETRPVEARPASYQPRTNRERLAAKVDEVCALARK